MKVFAAALQFMFVVFCSRRYGRDWQNPKEDMVPFAFSYASIFVNSSGLIWLAMLTRDFSCIAFRRQSSTVEGDVKKPDCAHGPGC